LAAKPIVDIVLVVADSSDEAAYVPAMENAGYVLRIREPDWFEHRLFNGPDTVIGLHVFSAGSLEIERMLLFRDWLRFKRSRSRAVSKDEARAGPTRMAVHPELRRRQDASRPRDRGPRRKCSKLAVRLVNCRNQHVSQH